MTYKAIVITISATTVLALAVWTTFLSLGPQHLVKNLQAQLPDGIMEDVHAVMMDKFGKPTMKIVTPKLVHYPEHDRTELYLPELTLYRKSPTPWLITSKYANATDNIEIVDFWQDVKIHHPAEENAPATLIKTPKLRVHPNKKIAETAEPIVLSQPDIVVNAIGMLADMNTGDIKLLSEAKGEYVPNS